MSGTPLGKNAIESSKLGEFLGAASALPYMSLYGPSLGQGKIPFEVL